MNINENNFIVYAMKAYDNPNCLDEAEFHRDLGKIKRIKKQVNFYINDSNHCNIRLMVNTVLCFYNVFESHMASEILLFKLEDDYLPVVNTILWYLNLPLFDEVTLDNNLLVLLREL